MTITEILQFVDNLIFTETDQHLDDLQKRIIEELFKGKTYKQIAELYNYDEGYIGDESRKLFKTLSDKLGENINKSNFAWTLERVINSKIVNSLNNNINLCSNNKNSINYQSNNIKNSQETEIQKSSYHDLTLSPRIIRFYGREKELEYLSNCILNQNTPLISILGLSGIGKTTLVKRFVDFNLDKFEVIIWKSLKYPKSLNSLIDDLLQVCKQQPEKNLDDKIKQLFNILSTQKCLIILDDIQNIFTPGELAGKYQPEYQDYQPLFKLVTETQHQSNIILISQEQCPEMESLDPELYPIKSLELSGLYHSNILQNTGLKNQDSWLDLIKLYAGNLMFLKTITVLIAKNYDGEVVEFLAENTLHITQQMQSHFQETFNRLSPIEKQIVLYLSRFENPISREELRQTLIETLNLSSVDFNNGLQSLQQRHLVSKLKEDKVMFSLSSVFREYVRNFSFP
ncbi:AAA family ATPase [Sphaerospermopsis sp. LEGE 00249]|uniref:NB-ARC domain-containing protein n=1 Tax=Sphaerospermopsis sp. LEGE 00249 TaxID=1380707 RepID=UPI00164DDB5C|nr:NB-ARC domain-containing protein [Sphaerospermopsis sp. LEGE 00249]MBC5794655.1 AAA family ATPase [Sphaerospermopsis sp. LEGE 00249]